MCNRVSDLTFFFEEAIFFRAADLASGGGRIVYTTSSILQQENEGIVEQFLRRFKDEYELLPAKSVWEEVLPDVPWPLAQNDFFKMLPSQRVGPIFVAVVKRKT